jgi:hypothetical protein
MLLSLVMPATVFAAKPSDNRIDVVNQIADKHIKENTSRETWLVEMEANGFKLVSTEQLNALNDADDIGIMSNEDQCIDLPTLDIFEDVNNPGQYVAGAWFFWNNDLWESDLPFPCPYSGHMGGKDCFGISFSRPINILSKTFQTWDNGGTRRINSTMAENQSSYGVSFKKYDDYNNAGILYYWDSGFLSLNFTPQQTGSYAGWQTMGHTWASTDISSISIGSSGISVGFTSTNDEWKAVAPYSGTYTFY